MMFRKLTYVFAASAILTSCTDDFQETNTNPVAVTRTDFDNSLVVQGLAFAQAQYMSINGLHWRFQIAQNLFSDIWSQYYATTQSRFDSDRYVQVGSWSDLAWNSFYGEAAPQIFALEQTTEANGDVVNNAFVKILKAHAYQRITDYWGPVPYSEFGNGQLNVAYDAQEDIYNDLFTTLDEAVAVLKANPGAQAYASNDLMYAGNADQWLKFANSLRLRMAMRIRFANPSKAQAEAEKAIADGVITSNTDNALVKVSESNRNPLETITNWGEFRMSAAMESVLEGYEDPRLPEYFSPAADGDTDGDGSPYEGLLNGQTKISLEAGQNNKHSDLGVKFLNVGRGGSNPPIEVMNAAEVAFLRAEGALAGWNMGGTAQSFYEEGIRLSMQQKTSADASAIASYISSTNTPVAYDANSQPLTDIPVAFSADPETQLEQIITQKWLAIYPNGWEAWAELRRTGYPKQYTRVVSENPNVAADQIMRRMMYVQGEYTLNGNAVQAALALPEMAAGDKNSTKVWWDKR